MGCGLWLSFTDSQLAAAKEIQDIYNAASKRDLSRREIEAEMAQIIRAQASRGVFISDHLRNNAADVCSIGMITQERAIFQEV